MTPHLRTALYLASTLLVLVTAFGSAQAAVVQFNIPLSGNTEVPRPGDADGSGLAVFIIDSATNTINWNITTNNIALPITGAHIHQAAAGVAGPIVVNFDGRLSGVGLVDTDIASILANAQGFYVNIHNTDFPGGAIRGQFCESVPAPVPVPAAVWLFGSGLMGLVGVMRRRTRR